MLTRAVARLASAVAGFIAAVAVRAVAALALSSCAARLAVGRRAGAGAVAYPPGFAGPAWVLARRRQDAGTLTPVEGTGTARPVACLTAADTVGAPTALTITRRRAGVAEGLRRQAGPAGAVEACRTAPGAGTGRSAVGAGAVAEQTRRAVLCWRLQASSRAVAHGRGPEAPALAARGCAGSLRSANPAASSAVAGAVPTAPGLCGAVLLRVGQRLRTTAGPFAVAHATGSAVTLGIAAGRPRSTRPFAAPDVTGLAGAFAGTVAAVAVHAAAGLAVRGVEADLPAPHHATPARVADVLTGAGAGLLHVHERCASSERARLHTAPAGCRARPVAAHPARTEAAGAFVAVRASRACHQLAPPRAVAGGRAAAAVGVRARGARHAASAPSGAVALHTEPFASALAADLVDAETADAVRVDRAGLSEHAPAVTFFVAAVTASTGVGVRGQTHHRAHPRQAGQGAAPASALTGLGAADAVSADATDAIAVGPARRAEPEAAPPGVVAAALTGTGIRILALAHHGALTFPARERAAPARLDASFDAANAVDAEPTSAAAVLRAGLARGRLRQANTAKAVVALEAVLVAVAARHATLGAGALEWVAGADLAGAAATFAWQVQTFGRMLRHWVLM